MDEKQQAPDVMTLEEAALYLRLNIRTMYNLLKNGALPARKVGKQWRFSRAALDAWLAGNGNTGAGQGGGADE